MTESTGAEEIRSYWRLYQLMLAEAWKTAQLFERTSI